MIETSQKSDVPRIGLFIDFDNGQLNIARILNALRERGIILLKKAYGDWQKFSQHRKVLAEYGVDLVERPTIHAGGDKNGADIQLAVEALEACLTNPFIDVFVICSGDSDFLPLISRLQAHNKKVFIIGHRNTTSSVVQRNCNEYLAYENLGKTVVEEEEGIPDTVVPELDPSNIETAFALLRRAIILLEDQDRSVDSSLLKQKMLQLSPTFDERTYGFVQFKLFLAEAQKNKIIHIGKKVDGSYPVSLGRIGKMMEDEEEEQQQPKKPAMKRKPRPLRKPRGK